METAVFVSDLHLGALYPKANPKRAELFVEFLNSWTGQAGHLVILGDLFEFWMEYRHYIPKGYFDVLAAIRDLQRRGTEIHYLCGNHDFNLGNFFSESLGITVHDGPLELTLQGKRVLLLHGDGLDPTDISYRLMRAVLRHPLSNRLYRLLHPDLGMALALRVGKLSRDRHGNVPRHLPKYEAAARKMLQQGHDILVHGHVHAGFVKNLPEGTYVNTGEWFERLQYVEMKNGKCVLKSYVSSHAQD